MFIIGNLFIALADIFNTVLFLMQWIIIIRALISWVNPDPFSPIVQFLYRATEPVLEPIRRFVPMRGIDFSPIIALLLIVFLQRFFVQSMLDLGMSLKAG